MSWLEKTPWLSIVIFFITYAVFGWWFARNADLWTNHLLELGENWAWFLEQEAIFIIIHILAITVIILISLCLTTPIALVTFVFKAPLDSNIKGFSSILIWSLLLVLVLSSIHYFANLLVMISSAILTRLDLLKLGCKNWQIFLIITLLGTAAFGVGMLSFRWENQLI
jgi:hypothetical protein